MAFFFICQYYSIFAFSIHFQFFKNFQILKILEAFVTKGLRVFFFNFFQIFKIFQLIGKNYFLKRKIDEKIENLKIMKNKTPPAFIYKGFIHFQNFFKKRKFSIKNEKLIIYMKYTTRNIVDRALALTDFNDDFFIGNEELTNLLNDKYFECYEILINNGDKSFLKTSSIGNDQKLPKDFFKLESVKIQKTFLYKGQDYDIINSTFKLLNGYEEAEINYYPQPKPLCLKPKDIEILPFDNVITKWQDGYILSDNTVIDENGNTLITLESPVTILSNGYIKEDGIYDLSNNKLEEIRQIKGNEITYDKVEIDTDIEDVIAVLSNRSNSWYYILDSNHSLYNQDDVLVMENFNPVSLYVKDEGIYYVQDNKIYKILGNLVEHFPSPYQVKGILDNSYISVALGLNNKKVGYGIDSILDIPSSTFWTYFAYSLAVSICNVVQRENEALQSKLEEVRELFVNSVVYDGNSSYTLRDVERIKIW